MATATTSYRIPPELKEPFEKTAKRLKKNKSWIMTEALRAYLHKNYHEWLRDEARLQSLAVSKIPWKDEEFWEKVSDEAINGN